MTGPVDDASRPSDQGPGAAMLAEIDEQPERLADLLAAGAVEARRVGRLLAELAPQVVLFAGRGTSDHACLYGKYLVEVGLGLPAGLMSPSTMTVYGGRPDLRGSLVVVASQSGTSPDLVETATVARDCGATVLAVTNAPASELASLARYHLDVRAGQERAVAATKSYTAELLTLWLTIDAWRGGDGTAAAAVPAAAARQVDMRENVRPLRERLASAERLVVTGRGFAYPTACEGALKIMETSYLAALAFSGADLLHGPLAMIDRTNPVIAVVPDGAGGDAMAPVLQRLRSVGADVTVVGGPAHADPARGDVVVDHRLTEELSPVVDVIALQQLAHAMAVSRGLDPDAPRFLTKATSTW
jgi:glutamine---fructose-6-phosphate transaminase (isomerizing)